MLHDELRHLSAEADIGYKNVDFNVSKTFKMPWSRDQQLTVYFQALNVFDFVNRNYSMWGGGFRAIGGPAPTHDLDPGRSRAKAELQGRPPVHLLTSVEDMGRGMETSPSLFIWEVA